MASIHWSWWSSRKIVASAGVLYVWSSREFSIATARSSVTRRPALALRVARSARSRGASSRRARGRRRSRSTSAARSSRRRSRRRRRGPRPRPTCRRPARARRPSGRCTGTVTPVDVSLCGYAYASPSTWSGRLGALARRRLAHLRVVEVRCGAGDGGELRRELADHEMGAPAFDEAERRRIPEQRRAAVADQHLVAIGKREQVGEPGADATRRPTARLRGGGSCP